MKRLASALLSSTILGVVVALLCAGVAAAIDVATDGGLSGMLQGLQSPADNVELFCAPGSEWDISKLRDTQTGEIIRSPHQPWCMKDGDGEPADLLHRGMPFVAGVVALGTFLLVMPLSWVAIWRSNRGTE